MSWSGQFRVQVSIQLRIYRWTWGKGKKTLDLHETCWAWAVLLKRMRRNCNVQMCKADRDLCCIRNCILYCRCYIWNFMTIKKVWMWVWMKLGLTTSAMLLPSYDLRCQLHPGPKINTRHVPNASKNCCWRVYKTVSIAGFVNSNNAILWEHERASAALSRKFKFCQFKYSSVLGVGSFLCANVQNTCQKSRVSDNAWILN